MRKVTPLHHWGLTLASWPLVGPKVPHAFVLPSESPLTLFSISGLLDPLIMLKSRGENLPPLLLLPLAFPDQTWYWVELPCVLPWSSHDPRILSDDHSAWVGLISLSWSNLVLGRASMSAALVLSWSTYSFRWPFCMSWSKKPYLIKPGIGSSFHVYRLGLVMIHVYSFRWPFCMSWSENDLKARKFSI